MTEHRFILEKYKGMKTRHICPQCNKKELTLYIDTKTGDHVSEYVGKCNRLLKCGYHYTPKQYFESNPEARPKEKNPLNFDRKNKYSRFQICQDPTKLHETLQIKSGSFLRAEVLHHSLKNYENNNFIKYLQSLFSIEIVQSLIKKYFIGTSDYWPGSTIFWQIDQQGKIHAGKVILYNSETGKRIKEPFNHIHWVHKIMKLSGFELKQCFFGLHLINDSKPIALCESEKTAIIASVYLPEFIWIASGGLQNINENNLSIIKGRSVYLFPDANGFEAWSKKANDYSHICKFTVSTLLQDKATDLEKNKGYDIADFLILNNYKEFTANRQSISNGTPVKLKPNIWNNELQEMECFFNSNEIPGYPIETKYHLINDPKKFIENYFQAVKEYNGNPNFYKYLVLCRDFKEALKQHLHKNEN